MHGLETAPKKGRRSGKGTEVQGRSGKGTEGRGRRPGKGNERKSKEVKDIDYSAELQTVAEENILPSIPKV